MAGVAWRVTRQIWAPALAEVIGTGIIAAVVSGVLVAPAIMGSTTTAFTFMASFLASTIVGTAIGVAALWALRRAEVVVFDQLPLGLLAKRSGDD